MSDTKHTVATYEGAGFNGDYFKHGDDIPEQGSRADEAGLELYGVLHAFEAWLDGGATSDRQEMINHVASFARVAGLEPGQLELFPEDTWQNPFFKAA
jgi:hypothetical protein